MEGNYTLREYEIHHDTNEEFLTIIDKNVTKEFAQEHLHDIYRGYYEDRNVASADFNEDFTVATINFKNNTSIEYRIGTGYREGEEKEFNNLN